MKTIVIGGLLLAALPIHPAFALEGLKTYDNFSEPAIDGTRWLDAERSASIKNGALVLSHRTYGLATSDTGSFSTPFRTFFSTSSAITEIKAKITVNGLETNACPTNPFVAFARARINGSFFNIGTPVGGSEVGDKIAQLRIVRFSNSTDADNVLRVQGLVFTCTNADCSTNNNAHLVDLGTVRIGKAVLGEVQWDKPNKQFIFTRDNGDFQGTVAYTDDDSHPPSIGFKELGDRIDVANCVGAAAPTGYVNTSFDSVQVNKSAVP